MTKGKGKPFPLSLFYRGEINMSEVIGKWLTVSIAIIIMFTPILGYLDSLHREAVEVTLTEGAKKAAIAGRFTPDIIQEMKDDLVDHYNFTESDIEITATTAQTPRNQYIEATIRVPRGILFVLDLFNQGPEHIEKSTRILSEYVQ
jgi:NACalpha-BTF3-like transcription factor